MNSEKNRGRRVITIAGTLLALLVSGVVSGLAQGVMGPLHGRVSNSAGAGLRNLKVVMRCHNTQTSYVTKTSSFGYYSMMVPYDCVSSSWVSTGSYTFDPDTVNWYLEPPNGGEIDWVAEP